MKAQAILHRSKSSFGLIPVSIPVKAYYVANAIDIVKTTSSSSVYFDRKFQFQSKSITITIDEERQEFISIFKYGAVVFFNVPETNHTRHIQNIRDVAMKSSISDALQHTEQYQMYVNSALEKASVMKKSDQLFIRSLDSKNLQIVGAVMGQTVALDYYAVSVDRMLDIFMQMNNKLEERGQLQQEDRLKLYKLLASNNNVIANIISRIGILEGTDAGWEDDDADSTWQALRRDFEIMQRFKDLSLKVDLVSVS